MNFRKISSALLTMCLFAFTACNTQGPDKPNNGNGQETIPYILSAEDASNADITRFYAFDPTKVLGTAETYDLIAKTDLFTNSDPSTSAGHHSLGKYFFAMAKDKKGMSATPGVFRLTLNDKKEVVIDESLTIVKGSFYPKRLGVLDKNTAFYSREDKPRVISIFNPYTMQLTGEIDFNEAIKAFKPDAKYVDAKGNNLVRTGSFSIDARGGKLFVSVVFLNGKSFNEIGEEYDSYYVAVADIATKKVEKIISYKGVRNVGIVQAENSPTSIDEKGNIYYLSWGWNGRGVQGDSKVFRIKAGTTEFDNNWEFDIQKTFGNHRIAQSMIAYNGKIYLHISKTDYRFGTKNTDKIEMEYYELDPATMAYKQLPIPASNISSRMNVFSVVDGKLFVCVPNREEGKFNGLYSVDKAGKVEKVMSVKNQYRPVRLYKLTKE